MWKNCTVYDTYFNQSKPRPEMDNLCRHVASFYGVSLRDIQKWNPSL